jgi:hypothetical protein
VARYPHTADQDPPAPSAMDWNSDAVAPLPNPLPPGTTDANIPVLVWQYHGDYPPKSEGFGALTGAVDLDLVNPAFVDALAAVSVLPPAP